MEVSQIACGCLPNTYRHSAKKVGVPSEEGFSARGKFHTKFEMTTPIGGFNPNFHWAGKRFWLERFQQHWQCATMLY